MSDRIPHNVMADELSRMAASKQTWLGDFSDGRNKRADHEIETRRRELSVLRQAEHDYRNAAERAAA